MHGSHLHADGISCLWSLWLCLLRSRLGCWCSALACSYGRRDLLHLALRWCCLGLMRRSLGLGGAIRVSLGIYNDSSDLERFFHALDQALELLQ